MRFSDLAGKELIDVREGLRLGELGDAELVFEIRTGKVRAIVVSPQGPWWRRSREMVIPWAGVRKIGVDVIVVDMAAGADDSLAGGGLPNRGEGPLAEGGPPARGERPPAAGRPSGGGDAPRHDRWNGGTGAGHSAHGWGTKGDLPDNGGGGGGFWAGARDGSAFFFRRR